ncbi:MAG: NUDIX hydrolase [Candidatus Aenigmatarchaeota archaeon]|nr:NUDIX hydrolase [Nanoarchaeota archaeon]
MENATEIIHDTVAVVVEQDGKFLVARKAKGFLAAGEFGFPAGHVDEGEDILTAMKREAKEETNGVEVVGDKPFLVFVHDAPKSRTGPHQHKCHVFRGKVVGDLIPDDDADELTWFTKEEILSNPKVQEWAKTIIKEKY